MKITTKKICLLGVLTAMGLSLFVLENALPSFPVFPYIKIGVANVITLLMLYGGFNGRECLAVLALRIALGALLTGQLMTVIFSGAGGLLAFVVMLILRRFFPVKYLPVTSVFGALAHNAGQIAAAIIVYGSFSVLYYLPFLILGGIGGGLVTGFAVKLIFKLHPRLFNKFTI